MNPQNQPTSPNPQPTVAESTKKCKHTVMIIILAILAIGGIGFGGYELWQNIQKDDEIKNLQAENADGQKEDEKTEEGLVSTALSKKATFDWPADIERGDDEPEKLVFDITIPKINIDTEVAKNINQKIYDIYARYTEEYVCSKGPCEIKVEYDYAEREKVLFIILKEHYHSYRATGSADYTVIYYDIKNDKELSVEDVAEKFNIDERAIWIMPTHANSFDYSYRDEQFCYRLGCQVLENTF